MLKYIILLAGISVTFCNEVHNVSEQFIPTNDWQVIKEGQSIPKGLHVRINLSTGLREAKLLSTDEDKNKAVATVKDSVIRDETTREHTIDSLQEALKNMNNYSESNDYELNIKKKFRSLEELKESLQQSDLAVKSESEIMIKLFNDYKTLDMNNTGEIIRVLQDLEYLVHNYDNGIEFIKLKGVEDIILPNIVNQPDAVVIQKLVVLGACMQNNQHVQKIIFEHDIGTLLLKLIDIANNDVKNKAIYALGSLTRRYPEAQKKLIVETGSDILSKILNDFTDPDIKVKLRIITLIHDLITEQNLVSAEYGFNYKSLLKSLNFCHNLKKLIVFNQKHFPNNHDNIEKILVAMNLTLDYCGNKVTGPSSFISTMRDLTNIYLDLAVEENVDLIEDIDKEYFANMLSLIDGINESLKIQLKQEL